METLGVTPVCALSCHQEGTWRSFARRGRYLLQKAFRDVHINETAVDPWEYIVLFRTTASSVIGNEWFDAAVIPLTAREQRGPRALIARHPVCFATHFWESSCPSLVTCLTTLPTTEAIGPVCVPSCHQEGTWRSFARRGRCLLQNAFRDVHINVTAVDSWGLSLSASFPITNR